MKFNEILALTNDYHITLPSGAVLVYCKGNGAKYFRLIDYVVSSAVSGPALVMVRR